MRFKLSRKWFYGVALILISACNSVPTTAGDADLQAHWQRWNAANLQDYDLHYQKICYCLPDVLRPVVVEVRSGKAHRAFYEDDSAVVSAELELETIPSLFKLIAQAQEKSAHAIDLSFDKDLSYPSSITIDYHARMVDDEVKFSHIKVVKNKP